MIETVKQSFTKCKLRSSESLLKKAGENPTDLGRRDTSTDDLSNLKINIRSNSG